MKTLAKVLAVAMVASFLIVGNAMATEIGPSSIPTEPTLQEVLDGSNAETLNTGLNALADQIAGGMFWIAGDYELSMFSSGARADSGRIGYYEIGNIANIVFFDSLDTLGETVSFHSEYSFGLVWENTTNALYSYSVDADNSAGSGYWQAKDGNALALSYIYITPFSTTFIVAFEDRSEFHGDGDFQDVVFKLKPTPEPGTMILLGAGLAALAVLRKKIRK